MVIIEQRSRRASMGPASLGHRRPAPMSAQSPAAASRHFGGCARLVDENEAFGVEIGLGLEPGPPMPQHVYSLLLAGVRRFFEGDAVAVEEAPHRALGDPQPVLALQMGRNLRQGCGMAPIQRWATLQSWTFPGVRSRTRGLPFASQTAWSLVLRPPLVRPMPWAKAPRPVWIIPPYLQ